MGYGVVQGASARPGGCPQVSAACTVRNTQSHLPVPRRLRLHAFLRQMLDLLKVVGLRPARGRRVPLSAEARADIVMWLQILQVFDPKNTFTK